MYTGLWYGLTCGPARTGTCCWELCPASPADPPHSIPVQYSWNRVKELKRRVAEREREGRREEGRKENGGRNGGREEGEMKGGKEGWVGIAAWQSYQATHREGSTQSSTTKSIDQC